MVHDMHTRRRTDEASKPHISLITEGARYRNILIENSSDKQYATKFTKMNKPLEARVDKYTTFHGTYWHQHHCMNRMSAIYHQTKVVTSKNQSTVDLEATKRKVDRFKKASY